VAVAPYGSWRSTIIADALVEQVVRLAEVQVGDGAVYWNEGRPSEAGRQVIVRWSDATGVEDVVPEGWSARTTVHEYGGGAYAVHGSTVFFSNHADQRVYRLDRGEAPAPLTPEPAAPRSHRYADGRASPDGRWLVCVRERHMGEDVVNDLVALSTVGEGEAAVVADGHDFFAAPRLSPDGRTLAWLCWDHPRMPWDGTELWEAEVSADLGLHGARQLAGGDEESVSQPRWSPDGVLHWVSDRTGWWNLYRDDGGQPRAVSPMEAELTAPDWVFGQSTYGFLADGRLVAAWARGGFQQLGVLEPGAAAFRPLDVPLTTVSSLQPYGAGFVAICASGSREPAVVAVGVDDAAPRVLRANRARPVETGPVSEPRPIEFPSEGGRTAHALYYPPVSAQFEGPEEDRPPLVVLSHGGPTSAASPALSLSVQFWTTRGVAVVDVDYGGSTGYGRAYRQLLNGQWGVVDVEDCLAAARHLAGQGEVDGERMVIRGGSAGGYTTLCALTFHDMFAAGASHYGVADAEALALHTHKFESRYLDGLIGPYPEARDLYRARSPVHFADRLSAPLIIFQGLEDEVVPPEQAEVMVEALRANGIPFAYLAFEGEQHGFRKAETIKRVAEAELSFYGQVLGFDPADDIEPVPVERP
jgi:dipeptidyl aminopeptidase/acylaminoacyl peptidase